MQNLSVSLFLTAAVRVFIHPFRALTEIGELVREQTRKSNFRFAFLAFLFGNTALSVGTLVMDQNGMWDSVGFVLFHILFQLTASFIFSMVMVAFFYLLLVVFSKDGGPNPEIDKMICLYFVPDMLWTVVLPLSFFFRALGSNADILYGLAALVILVLTVLMKIKALSLAASISGGRSAVVFFLPVLLFLGVLVLGGIYFAAYVARMFL